MPLIIISRLILQLASLALLALGARLLWSWWDGYDLVNASGVIVAHVHGQAWRLYTGLAFGAWSFGGGRLIVLALLPGGHSPMTKRAAEHVVTAPDGSKLHVEVSGMAQGPTLILTHGWGLNSTVWGDAKEKFGSAFRVIVWDLPGLGRSRGPSSGKYSIDGFAEALGAVVTFAGAGPVVLVGHSIGGMTTQTLFRAAPEAVRRNVAGVVLVDTTHQDPVHTMWLSGLWKALKTPLIEPLMHLMIWFSPFVWLSSWQGYLSGSNQIVMRLTGFGRYATRGQVDLTARLASKGSPAVQAKGNLAMLRWRITDILPSISAPTLVLVGSRDIVTLPSASQTISTAVQNATLINVEGCGHMGFLERHETYNAKIADFAEKVLAPARSI